MRGSIPVHALYVSPCRCNRCSVRLLVRYFPFSASQAWPCLGFLQLSHVQPHRPISVPQPDDRTMPGLHLGYHLESSFTTVRLPAEITRLMSAHWLGFVLRSWIALLSGTSWYWWLLKHHRQFHHYLSPKSSFTNLQQLVSTLIKVQLWDRF